MRSTLLATLALSILAGCKREQPPTPAADSTAMAPTPMDTTTSVPLDDPTIVSIFDAANTYTAQSRLLSLLVVPAADDPSPTPEARTVTVSYGTSGAITTP